MATVDRRYTTVLGPIKMEVLDLSSVVDGESVSSLLQAPQFAIAANQGDASGSNGISAAVSGKDITIHDPDVTDVILVVFGF